MAAVSPRLQLRVDPWPADYEGPLHFEAPAESPAGRVDAGAERKDWRALSASEAPGGRDLLFVDGSRRVEVRVLADHNGHIVHGLFGSLAVGAVRCAGRRASFEEIRLERHLVMGKGWAQSEEVRIGGQPVRFGDLTVIENSSLEVMAALQNRMRQAEAELAESLSNKAGCIFVDGPLTYFAAVRSPAVGVVKTLHQPYLEPRHFELVPQLRQGQRTPLFAILDGKSDRYSWFLRVAEPRPLNHPLAGIVRLEARQGLGREGVQRLAGLSSAHLPRFASNPIRDPRAPQNLLPIGVLEDEMRRRMGDPLFLRRAIERHLFQAAGLHAGVAA